MSRLKTNSLSEAIQELRPDDVTINRISTRWSSDEAQLAIKGFRDNGKDYLAIAEIIGTKTEQHVRQFYTNYRKRYNLDNIVKEFEAQQQQQDQNNINSDSSKAISSTSDIKIDSNKRTNEIMEVSIADGLVFSKHFVCL